MKLKGSHRYVLDSEGKSQSSMYPATREEAFVEDIALYYPPDFVCPVHSEKSVHYTLTGISKCCANRDSVDAYNKACLDGEPTSIDSARKQNKNYYWFPKPGPYCGHPGKITLAGKCAICADTKANRPRQDAIREGAIWYQPSSDNPCPRGHTAPRRVTNGGCQQCEAEYREARKAHVEQPVHVLMPDLIISRADALLAGFKAYRTGKPCGAGHTGWRYISTGGCIDCKNGVAPPAA